MLKIKLALQFQVLALLSFRPDEVLALMDENLMDWKVPESIKKAFPCYHLGFDYDGRPVLVNKLGQWKSRPYVEKGGEEFENLKRYNDQFVERVRIGYYHENVSTEVDGATRDNHIGFIMDYDGFSADEFHSIEILRYQFELNGKFGPVYANLEYGFIINANPFVVQMLRISKPYLGKLLEKVEVHGTNSRKWIPRLLRKISRDQLPPEYGGPKDFQPIGTCG